MTLPAWALTTVAAARLEVHATSTISDEKMEQLVRAASARINTFCGYTLKSTVYSAALGNRIALDGNDTSRIRVTAFPVTAFTAAAYLDADGVESAITTTGYALDQKAGIIMLRGDYFPHGHQNILISCTAGLVADSEGLAVAEHACLRLVAAWFDRWKNALGITTSANEGGVTTTFAQDEMPQEVVGMLHPFVWMGWS